MVTAEVTWVYDGAPASPRLGPPELAHLRASGLNDADLLAGRIVRVQCAVMADGWWDGLTVLPPGAKVARGSTVRVRITDLGDNARLGVNEFVGLLSPQLPTGGQAYRFIPNWRELGRRTNFERVELPPEHRDKYLIVQGSYLLKCST